MNRSGHREIDRCHYLITHFHYRYRDSCMMQIFCHFQSDKTCTNYDCTFYSIFCEIGFYMIGIFDIAEGKNTFRIDTFQWRSDRCGSR